MTLTRKFFVLALAIVFSVGCLGYFFQRHSYEKLDRQLSQIGLGFIRRVASETNLFLDRYEIMILEMRNFLATMKEEGALRGDTSSADYDVPVVEDYLNRLYQANKDKGILNVFLVMADSGWLLDSQNWPAGYQADFRNTPWHQEAMKHEGVSFSDPYFDVITNQIVFNVLTKVQKLDGTPLGTLGVAVRMDDFRKLLTSQHLATANEGFHLFVHRNGDLLNSLPNRSEKMWDMRSDKASYRLPQNITVPTSYVPETLAVVGKIMIEGEIGCQDLYMDGEEWRMFFAPTRTNLIIGYLYPKNYLYEQGHRLLLLSFSTTSLALGLILIVFLPMAKELHRVVSGIRQTSKSMGDFLQAIHPPLPEDLHPKGQGREGKLSYALTLMRQDVQEQEKMVKFVEFREILNGIDAALSAVDSQQQELVLYAQEVLSVNREVKGLNQKLLKRELIWANLLEITKSISVATDFQLALEQVTDAIRSMCGAYGVGVIFADVGHLKLLTFAGNNAGSEEERSRIFLSRSLVFLRVLNSRSPRWLEDVRSDPEYPRIDPAVVSEIEFPLIHAGEALGLLFLSFDQKTPYSDEFLTVLLPITSSLAGHLATWKAHREIRASYEYLIAKFQDVADIYHHETADHLERVSRFSAMAAAWMGCTPQEQEEIMVFSRVHDLGKIRVPIEIIMKPGPLNAEEREIMKMHPSWGAELIGDAKWLQTARNICLAHHERWDGRGYPHQLAGEAIPLEGRIVNLADIYDALRSVRSYKKAFSHEDVVKIILEGDGRTEPGHFDPDLLAFFRTNHEEIGKMFDETTQNPEE